MIGAGRTAPPMAESLALIVGACFGSSGLTALVVALLQRHWAKQDRQEEKENEPHCTEKETLFAVREGLKVLMVDRVRYLGKHYITDNGIQLEDKETLDEMYAAYKKLGGNGHLDTVMKEVGRLPILDEKGERT